MMKSDYRCSLTFLAFLCMLKACELCFVRASRAHKFVPEGSSLKLSCEVQCGVLSWTGGWVFQEMQSTGFTRLTPSERIKLSNYSSTANSTHLLVHIHNINQSDAGSYKCEITWTQRDLTSNGHVTYVNVTAPALVDSSGRNLSHRILLCLSASMCFPLVLGLVWCLTRDHPPPPPVPPRSYTSFATRVKPKKELVYAEVTLKNSRRQNDCPKQVPEPTVYSSVHFS